MELTAQRNRAGAPPVQPSMRSRGRRSGLAVAVGTALLVAACSNGSAGDGGPASTSAGASAAAGTASAPAGSSTRGPAPPKPATESPAPQDPASRNPATVYPEDLPSPSRLKGRTLTVSGTVTAGVEAGCLLLGTYQLLGSARPELQVGRKVTVTGHLVPGIVTTCQQGTPFQVEQVVSTE